MSNNLDSIHALVDTIATELHPCDNIPALMALKKKYIGKEVKYYLAKHRESGTNPIQLEIENKIIFSIIYLSTIKNNY